MDLIVEFIVEVILEGIIELIQNKKISKWIRYPLLMIALMFYIFIFGTLIMILPAAFKENIFIGIFILCIEILLVIILLYIIRKSIIEKDIKEIQK